MSKFQLILLCALFCVFVTSVTFNLGCQPQSEVAACMEDDSDDEYNRCTLRVEAGDYDNNGVINWHDSYLYDHCVNICPECCVTTANYDSVDSAIHCPPNECPGPKCQCIRGVGDVWYLSPEVGD